MRSRNEQIDDDLTLYEKVYDIKNVKSTKSLEINFYDSNKETEKFAKYWQKKRGEKRRYLGY